MDICQNLHAISKNHKKIIKIYQNLQKIIENHTKSMKADRCSWCFRCSAEAAKPKQPSRSVVSVFLVFSRSIPAERELRFSGFPPFRPRLERKIYYSIHIYIYILYTIVYICSISLHTCFRAYTFIIFSYWVAYCLLVAVSTKRFHIRH